jgi:hypothetical protein
MTVSISRRALAVLMTLAIALAIGMPVGFVLASHQFGDVPSTNQFHGDIDAIADAQVTTGCGGGNFCPDGVVTREQMAAFMNRLGALSPGKIPVVNARRLDGYGVNEIVRAASDWTLTPTAALTANDTVYLTVSVSAPRVGFAVVTASITGREQACTLNCVLAAHLLHVEMDAGSMLSEEWIDERGSLSVTNVFEVWEPGTNTFELRVARPTGGDGNVNGWAASLNVVYVPFGGSGQVGGPPPP